MHVLIIQMTNGLLGAFWHGAVQPSSLAFLALQYPSDKFPTLIDLRPHLFKQFVGFPQEIIFLILILQPSLFNIY